ncbi:MAG: glutamate--cysteine ligase [Geminicoccaceae bacterium]
MSAPPGEPGAPVESKSELVAYLEAGSKPPDDWRIGTEHEKFCFYRDDLEPLAYDGERGIAWLLEAMADRFDWAPILEQDRIIGLAKDGAGVSLEPGGQLELSGAPLATIHDTCREAHGHLRQVKELTEPAGIGMLGMGFHPLWPLDAMPRMPKGRYDIMRRYMPTRGSLGLDMMHRTCTIQVNLDFSSEADMVRKLRVSLALQPIATALFANSPFIDGRPNGFESFRAHIWTDTDPDRSGFLPFELEEGMGFERYVDYVLDVPMYFVYHQGHYLDASGQSFRDFLVGRLPALPGVRPAINHWADHLSTVFPVVRLNRFLEMRVADGAPWAELCALPAFWVGLLYDATSLDAAEEFTKALDPSMLPELRQAVAKDGLSARVAGRSVRDLARETVRIARGGLERRGRRDMSGDTEAKYLEPIERIAETGGSQAREKLRLYETEWGRSVRPLFKQFAY